MKNLKFLSIAWICLLTTISTIQVSAKEKSKPNVIYILVDDLGYGELGCYGQKKIATPNIDKIADQGIKLTQHYSGSALCAPSRCVLMTGKHTGHAHIRDNKKLPMEGNEPIPAQQKTIAELFKQAGYSTGAIGKWGLGYPGSEGDPNNQGFDYFYGYNCQRQAHSYYPKHLWRNDKKEMLKGNNGKTGTQYTHDLFADDALRFIKENKEQPFFLYLPFTIPHTALQVPDLGQYENETWDEKLKIHAAMITRMDKDVGRIMALLKELNINKNTLLIFTSDNGPFGNGQMLKFFDGAGELRGRKGQLYEGGVRVPFVAQWPGKIKPGTTSDHISAFWDMFPTFAELLNETTPDGLDGISFLPELLAKKDQQQHEYLYWELKSSGGGSQAILMGEWKAIKKGINKGKNSFELYNLSSDPSEENDVSSEHQDVKKHMLQLMEEGRHTPEIVNFKLKGLDE